jgi:hypothetical protein
MSTKHPAPYGAETEKVALKKFAESNLTLTDARLLGMELLDAIDTALISPQKAALPSIKLNYYDYLGNPVKDKPTNPYFYRLRYLGEEKGFDGKSKYGKYAQPIGTAPMVYWPKNQNWTDIVNDTKKPLIITEGELKSACACKMGFPTLGLGGVNSYRAREHGMDWLDSWQPMDFSKRYVYVCFDSDYQTNKNVCTALIDLSEELERRGAIVKIVTLPNLAGDNKKTGLDDFLVSECVDSAEPMTSLLRKSPTLGLTRVLWGFNDRYTFITELSAVYKNDTGQMWKSKDFADNVECKEQYHKSVLDKNGKVSYDVVSAGNYWISWPMRSEVSRLAYAPGKEKIIEESGIKSLNTWRGWGCEPLPHTKDDIKPFTDLLDYVFEGAEYGAREWFEKWLAYPIQNPGEKMYSATLIHTSRQGAGKTLIGATIGMIYGTANFKEIDNDQLNSDFNGWASNKQFIQGEELVDSNRRKDAQRVKKMITQKVVTVNEKYVRPYDLTDCINFYLTSNAPDALFLEDNDRRVFVHEITSNPPSEEFFKAYDKWMRGDGPRYLRDYLEKLDVTGFNPKGPAFKTLARERMIVGTQSEVSALAHAIVESPDATLKVGETRYTKDLFTSRELLSIVDPEGRTKITANRLGRELVSLNTPTALGFRQVRIHDGSLQRYYIIRNIERWKNVADPKEISAYIKSVTFNQPTSKY